MPLLPCQPAETPHNNCCCATNKRYAMLARGCSATLRTQSPACLPADAQPACLHRQHRGCNAIHVYVKVVTGALVCVPLTRGAAP